MNFILAGKHVSDENFNCFSSVIQIISVLNIILSIFTEHI